MKKYVNGVLIDMTAEEINQFNIDVAESESFKEQKIAKENKKTSGKQKLKDLGLDDDEINALMGV